MTGRADYGMFSDAGDAAVDAVVVKAAIGSSVAFEDAVMAMMAAGLEQVREAGHREVWDTAVREAITVELDEAWQAAYGHSLNMWAVLELRPGRPPGEPGGTVTPAT